WTPFQSKCYRFTPVRKGHAAAELHCQNLGGNLASVHSEEANTFIKNLIASKDNSNPFTWLGGARVSQTNYWFWKDGSVFNYQKWGSGQPDNYCGSEGCLMFNDNAPGFWNDAECNLELNFVCVKNM
ncbi:galactose-specific lectin nattectin-like, partial [Polypterus senegalus]|uniref:galactose-specific lectin nattectin-like n=1 Tax=Polypterus senegalus TaxID=55291 RepID=UPI0019651EA7